MKDQALIKISRERIDTLFNEAKNTENINLARRYIRLMEKNWNENEYHHRQNHKTFLLQELQGTIQGCQNLIEK